MAGRLFTGLRGWRAVGFWFAALLALLSSAFAGVLIVSAMDPDQIEVRVFLDEAGDQLLDGVVGDALNPGLPAVDVLIFRDDGSIIGQADVGDTKVGPTYTTDAAGVVLVSGLNTAEQYWVAIDSRTIDPPSGNSGGGGGWVAEQATRSPDSLATRLSGLWGEPERLRQAAEAAKSLGQPRAAVLLAELAEKLAGRGKAK